MQIKLPFDASKSVVGEASIGIDQPIDNVFAFVGEHFFDNYPKWALEVEEFEPLDGSQPFVGAKARQLRADNGAAVESVFEIAEYQPLFKLMIKGITAPYKHSYLLEGLEQSPPTKLTFRFELSELEMFMRPFEKLIRMAIEEGAENTVENIKNLIMCECA